MSNPGANALLGYPSDTRLLIVNADDFGAYHAVNAAILRALTEGVARSTTLMAPCPWAAHAMRLREHPDIACGVHLTVVSEFPEYRWGPLTPRNEVPSLLDESGSFYSNDRQTELLDRARLESWRPSSAPRSRRCSPPVCGRPTSIGTASATVADPTSST